MVVIRNEYHLTMSGKVWEIKAKLKEMGKSQITLKEYLEKFSR